MSIDMARAFIERVKLDKRFHDQLVLASDANMRLQIARDSGYYFSENEFNEAKNKYMDKTNGTQIRKARIYETLIGEVSMYCICKDDCEAW